MQKRWKAFAFLKEKQQQSKSLAFCTWCTDGKTPGSMGPLDLHKLSK